MRPQAIDTATKMLTECLAIRRGLENPRETAAALSTLATLHLQQDDVTKAREYEEEAIGIFRELGDRLGEAIGLQNLGEISLQQTDDAGAQKLFDQCLALARSIEHQELESECERSLGELALKADKTTKVQAGTGLTGGGGGWSSRLPRSGTNRSMRACRRRHARWCR